jgi:hypothetical protein
MSAAAPLEQCLAVSSGSALDDVAVVDLVLRFAGAGQALFLKINKAWAACYESINSNDTASSSYYHVHTNNCTSFEAAFGSAARLRLAHKHGLPLNSPSVHIVADKLADSSTLTAAHELGMPWAAEVMYSMAKHNRLADLQWLHTEHSCKLPPGISAAGEQSGSIDMLKWLKAVGCAFDKITMRCAADHGHVVLYLRAEGCPWHSETCLAALRRGDRDLVLWALEHGFDVGSGEFMNDCWNAVIDTGSLEMVLWFDQLQLRSPGNRELRHAVCRGHVHICCYLKDSKHCGWGHNADMEVCAAFSDKLEMCEWLLEFNYPLDIHLLAEKATGKGKLTVLR